VPQSLRGRPLPEHMPRDVVEYAAACASPACGGTLRRPGEEVTEVLDYVSFRVSR
jgi:transposase